MAIEHTEESGAAEDADRVTRTLAADPGNQDDPTAWFDQLYLAAGAGKAVVPWDRGEPNALLVEWVEAGHLDGTPSAMVVGAGYGRDSEYLASLGLATAAFDVSPSAVAQTRVRFPDSPVDYTVADLLALPEEWHQAYGLVVESMNVQALPRVVRTRAIPAVSSLVAHGGRLLVIALGPMGPTGPPTRTTDRRGRCRRPRWSRSVRAPGSTWSRWSDSPGWGAALAGRAPPPLSAP